MEHTPWAISSPLVEYSAHIIQACRQFKPLRYNFSFTRYQSLLGWPELNQEIVWHFYTWSAARIEPWTFWSWVHCPIHLATCSHICVVAHGWLVTRSHQITEVKQRRTQLVLGWVIAARVTLLAMCRGVGQASHITPSLSTQQWWAPGGMRKLNCNDWL